MEGGIPYSFPKKERLRKGYELFKNDPWDLSRDFRLGRPLESEGVGPSPRFLRSGLVQTK